MKTTMNYKPTVEFLKNQLKSISQTNLPSEKVSVSIKDDNPIKVQLAKNLKLISTVNGFSVTPTSKTLSNGMTGIEAYKFFEYGTSEFSRDPISPSLRRHVERVIIPKIIKKMGNKIG